MLKQHPIPYSTHKLHDRVITVKRIDLVNPLVSGNKFYKLKYNLEYVRDNNFQSVVSFGGAYSNHIYALAQACNGCGIKSIGYIRGDELANKPLNHTLSVCHELGMELRFISRNEYRQKHSDAFLRQLTKRHPDAYIIPEGGSNEFAIKGTSEILSTDDAKNFDVIVCAVGTGGTISGIINSTTDNQLVIGISALNSTYQSSYIEAHTNKSNWQIVADDVFGGYGKYNNQLLAFIEKMQATQDLPLEPIYTGKALYRMNDILKSLHIKADARILFIHTGGLQAFSVNQSK